MRIRIFLILTILFIYSCATKQKIENFENIIPPSETSSELSQRIFLIGNPTEPNSEETQKTFNSLKNQLKDADENSLVIFLGNYFDKSCSSDNYSKNEIEAQLEPLVNTVSDFKGKVMFIPGSYDWKVNGLKGLKHQEEYIEEQLGKKTFLPEGGCSFKKVEIGDDIILLVVDGTWFVENWDNYPNINAECEINTRQRFFLKFEDQIKKARGKTTLVAISRPVVSNGPHGGHYSAKSDLTPLPILGNVKNILRTASGLNKDDMYNNNYYDMVKRITTLARQNKKVIFLSAHENNLQFVTSNVVIPQIITGSASKTAPAKKMKNTVYSEGAHGYAILDIFKDGASNIDFINTDTEEVTFSGGIFPPLTEFDKKYPKITEKEVPAAIFSNKEAHKDFLYRFLMGNRYRKFYGMDLMTKPAYLDTLYGGLTPIREGGGHQSISLHLQDQVGKQYVIRAFKKNSAQFLQAVSFRDYYMQDQLANSALVDLTEDFFTGSYPYAILLTEQLSGPINIPTLNTKVIYLPKQKALGVHNAKSGNKISAIEEHPKSGKYQLGVVPFEGNVYDTFDLLEFIEKNHKHQIDQKAFVRARIFDMLIGDWDRHYKQWKWLQYDEDGHQIYRPLPLDRDQAFSKMGDGLLTKIALFLVPNARIIANYSGHLRDVIHFNKEPYELDVNFLPDLTEEDWLAEARFIQESLPDEYVDQVFENMPPELKGKDLDIIKGHFKERRNRLQDITRRYCNYVYKYSKIMGTNKDDYFKIQVHDDKSVEVKVYNLKDGELGEMYHHRVYSPHETKEIWMYGLDDQDTFEVIGVGSSIKLILAGGPKNDTYIVPEHNRVHIHDFKSKKNDVSQAPKAHKHLMDFYDMNTFNFRKNYNRNFQILPFISANQDVGTEISLNLLSSKTKFKGTEKQTLAAHYYSSTGGYSVKYNLSLPKVIRRLDFNMNLVYNTENYSENFFGYGNNTLNFQDSLHHDYNRVLMKGYNLKGALTRGLWDGFNFSLATEFMGVQLDPNQGGISKADSLQVPNYLYNYNHYAGVNASVSFNNLDNSGFPKNGMRAALTLQYQNNMNHSNRSIFKISPSIKVDYNLAQNGSLVLATQLLGDYLLNNEYEFFQAASIGGNSGLRGFRNARYSGKASFSQSTDLRLNLRRRHTILMPASLGFYGGFDYGRVWSRYDTSRKFHYSYGGGVFVDFVNTVALNLGGFNSEEGFQVFFRAGFGF